jgi:signal transduction histidine kinase
MRVLSFLLLPEEISDFERRYLARVNGVALIFFLVHLPVLTLVALFNHTGPLLAFVLTSAVLIGPLTATHSLENPRTVSIIHGVCAMFMGGLLVHFGQGPMQIEMHFYFFALLAMCAVFGNPMVIVAAAATVALHHLVVYLALPSGVFNYDASVWVVAVHAGFVVLESIATCFISRSFFDNVIGLEKIVQARTLALDSKNRDMRVLLDSIRQGLLRINRAGTLGTERSAIADIWLGAPTKTGMSWFEYLSLSAPQFAASSELAWQEVKADVMPFELTLEQMPHLLKIKDRTFNVGYRPIGREPFDNFLVIVTDITSDVEREQVELERREVTTIFEHILADRSVFESFFEEGSQIVQTLARSTSTDDSRTRRLIHTLKGNASLYGIGSIAQLCHDLEDQIAREGRLPARADYWLLAERWSVLSADIERVFGKRSQSIKLDEAEYNGLMKAVSSGESTARVARRIRDLKLEPTRKRLQHFSEQAHRIATRLEKEGLEVYVDDNGLRLDPQRWSGFWSAFIHAIRNAIDHGIESSTERVAAGKSPNGLLELRTTKNETHFTIEVKDDGRGIDWNAVRARAAKAGVVATTTEELHDALFVDGVSTSSNVTDLSGRGVGMGALRHATRELGGELVVESHEHQGTLLRMLFPLATVSGAEQTAAA